MTGDTTEKKKEMSKLKAKGESYEAIRSKIKDWFGSSVSKTTIAHPK